MDKRKLKWKPAYEHFYRIVLRGGEKTELRVCAHGYDEQGEIRSTLYCTREGIFLQRKSDGWVELKPCTNPASIRSKLNKGSRYPKLRMFGQLHCHILVCTAFHGPRPEGYECDHVNGNNLDWSANNLRWVTKDENIRCGRYLKLLRKHGIDPKRVKYHLLLSLYSLPWDDFVKCLRIFDGICIEDSSYLSERVIDINLQWALKYV